MKKKISVFLSVILMMSMGVSVKAETMFNEEIITESKFTTSVDAIELLSNGGFETLASETTFDAWEFVCPKDSQGNSMAYLGSPNYTLVGGANNSKRALATSTRGGEAVHAHVGMPLTAGKTYELSGYAMHTGTPGSPFLNAIIYGNVNGATAEIGRLNLGFKDTPKNQWVQQIMRFTAPDNATSITVRVSILSEGTIAWDDISLLEEAEEIPEKVQIEKKPSLADIEISNNSFEKYTPGTRPEWYFCMGQNSEPTHPCATVSLDYAYTGKKSARIAIEGGAPNSWVAHNVSGIVPGATYQLSVFVLAADVNRIEYFSTVEWYTSEKPSTDAVQGSVSKDRWYLTQSDAWQELILEFQAPDNARSGIIRLRNFGPRGYIYIDEVTMYMVKAPDHAYIESDETFYYSEWPEGTVTAKANTYYGDALSGGYAIFNFVEENGAEEYKETVPFVNGSAVYKLKTEWMEEKGAEYKIKTKIYKADGTLVQEKELPIYRYERPTYLGADGIFRKNGKEYNIILGNGVTMDILEKKPEEAGITVVQIVGDANLSMTERMDIAYRQGLLVMVSMYYGSSSAGSLDRIESTKEMVKQVQNHPALFCYKVMDEPNQANSTDEELMRAYKTIRDLDPHHPVYLDDSGYDGYSRLYRYADLIDIDYYGGNSADSGRIFTTMMDYAKKATKGRKPFMLLQQAFTSYDNYLPTQDELRHFAYQAFFSGASGIGYHTLGSDDGQGINYVDRTQWKELCEKWAPWEQGFLLDAFVNQKYPQVNAFKDMNAMWRTFLVGGDIYAVVFNRNKSAVHPMTIPLTDGEGKTLVGAFSAERVAGGGKKTATGEGALHIELGALAAEIWKITPSAPVDMSYLKTTAFRDLSDYPWANQAIACLEAEGIVNRVSDTWYGPGQKITRGDFAMFLVRTLQLSGQAADTFSDVDADAEYANAIAIGKGLGILQGLGDGTFNPEGEITRQELMAITARGMRKKKSMVEGTSEDLAGFSDASVVADWAVLDVASMVRLGVVRGNADGTVNPLGNTTRAEAAVIMNRVMHWAGEP